jgi:hypothetical protein
MHNSDWRPTKYDPKTANQFDGGLYYDGQTIFSIREMDDDDVDYDAGCIGCLVGFYELGNPYQEATVYGFQFGDVLYTGYHSTNECMEDEYHTDGVWRIADDGYDCGTIAELAHELYEDGIDLSIAMREIDRLLGKSKVIARES